MEYSQIIEKIKSSYNPEALAGMARYGINTKNCYGASVYEMRRIGKEIGRNHTLALKLWKSGIHEARILAAIIDEPQKVTEEQMEEWVKDFDSWDVCDQCCTNLFDRTSFAWKKAAEWTRRKDEFVKRAGFTIMAGLAVHDRQSGDRKFEKLFSHIKREVNDERNYVKKAVNWALRNIGKRNRALNKLAIKTAKEIQKINTKPAKWIASDAIRELAGEKVLKRLRKNEKTTSHCSKK